MPVLSQPDDGNAAQPPATASHTLSVLVLKHRQPPWNTAPSPNLNHIQQRQRERKRIIVVGFVTGGSLDLVPGVRDAPGAAAAGSAGLRGRPWPCAWHLRTRTSGPRAAPVLELAWPHPASCASAGQIRESGLSSWALMHATCERKLAPQYHCTRHLCGLVLPELGSWVAVPCHVSLVSCQLPAVSTCPTVMVVVCMQEARSHQS